MKQRIMTGTLAGAGFLLLLYLGGYWFSSLIFLLSIVGYAEYIRMNRLSIHKMSTVLAYLGIFIFTFPVIRIPDEKLHLVLWLTMFALFVTTVISKNRVTIDHVALHALGVLYLGFGFHFMSVIREAGLFWALLVFVCIWATDSGAYFTGYAIGKHKLWPAISPKKTIEGAVGGIVSSIVAAACFHLYAPEQLPLLQAIWIGLFIAVIGQFGDLIQSAYKRVRGIKDTGTILPGHGGVLDRVDSWLIVFPFVYLFSLLPI